MHAPYVFSGFISRFDGCREPISITVSAPKKISEPLFCCEIETSLLTKSPYRIFSMLAHDAWAEAFETLNRVLQEERLFLVNQSGDRVELPSPPRDLSWVGPPTIPNVEGVKPIYRIEGWARGYAGEKRRVELAVWPPFEEEPGTFCAPMRCGLMSGGQVRCSYGATPEQAVHLAHKYLQIEVECRPVTDDDGRPLDIPIPPEPLLPKDENH
jgi:hypothetical protein